MGGLASRDYRSLYCVQELGLERAMFKMRGNGLKVETTFFKNEEFNIICTFKLAFSHWIENGASSQREMC